MRVVMLGPPGSGKGTQGVVLAARLRVPHVSTGDLLRESRAAGTDLGREAARYMDRGELVPDDVMVGLAKERVSKPDCQTGFVLDGFPRTLVQAEALDELLKEIGRELDVILELIVPEEVSVERMLERARIEGRSDDTPEAIRKRLDLYFERTAPVVEHYRATGNLVGIHGDRTVDEVFGEVQDALDEVVART